MKIVVIGGTGLIGSKTVAILRQGGHEVVAASPKSGINTITGEGPFQAGPIGSRTTTGICREPARFWYSSYGGYISAIFFQSRVRSSPLAVRARARMRFEPIRISHSGFAFKFTYQPG